MLEVARLGRRGGPSSQGGGGGCKVGRVRQAAEIASPYAAAERRGGSSASRAEGGWHTAAAADGADAAATTGAAHATTAAAERLEVMTTLQRRTRGCARWTRRASAAEANRLLADAEGAGGS